MGTEIVAIVIAALSAAIPSIGAWLTARHARHEAAAAAHEAKIAAKEARKAAKSHASLEAALKVQLDAAEAKGRQQQRDEDAARDRT